MHTYLIRRGTLQMILMPMLALVIAEEKLLSIGLFFACAHVSMRLALYSLSLNDIF